MIFGNVNDLETYSYLDDKILACFAYMKEHDMLKMDAGCHEIQGKDFFVNLCEYQTTKAEERFWEAHREYLDIHVMLSGREQIDLNFIRNMEQKEFVPENDFLPMEGNPNSHVILENGDFLICYPQDGHRTAIQVGESEQIRKAIFKVKI
ncbi:MAG: YhcH/YjgK/YiaL family protein [Roseburia sp.]